MLCETRQPHFAHMHAISGDSAWEAFEQEAAISEGRNRGLSPSADQHWQELSWEGLHELQMSGKAVQVISLTTDRPAGLR